MPSPALPPAAAARLRRARIRYAAVVVVALAAIGLTMGLVIGTGESAHATLVTGTAAPAVPGGTVRPAPTTVWDTDDRAASTDPLWVGTVVTWSEHTLSGRDAASGAVRWSYSRTDLSICDAVQQSGRAFVLFGRDGDCDELSTFDTQTGRRGWFRTLPDDGEGRLQFGGTGLVVSYPDSFHAMQATTGIDRFPMVPTSGSDCRFTSVVAGASGILASERCTDGEHLALWSNDGADSQPQRLWRVGVTSGVAAVAESAAAAFAYDPVSGTLSRYTTEKGVERGAVALSPTTTGPAGDTVTLGSDLLLDLGDRLYRVDAAGGLIWSAAAAGPPTLVTASNQVIADRVLVASADGAQVLDATSGSPLTTYSLPVDSGDGPRRVYAAGGGLLVASDAGLAYLR
ncbi:hypothetical protein ACXR2U_23815 [Jatrophihabitans sp. YIM 134969]